MASATSWLATMIVGAPIPQIVHAGDGRTVAVSRALTELTGYMAGDVPTFVDWIMTSRGIGRDEATEMFARLTRANDEARACPQEEVVVVARDGSRRHWISRVASVSLDDHSYFVSSATDVTERKLAELELVAKQQILERVLLTNPYVIYVFNLDARAAVFQNRHVAEAIGYTAADIIALGKDILPQLAHPDDLPRVVAHLEGMRDAINGELRSVEYRMRHRDGTWRWFVSQDTAFERDQHGKVSHILGTAADITDRKTADLELRAGRARLTHALYAANAAAWEWDVASNQMATTAEPDATVLDAAERLVVDFQHWLDQIESADRAMVHDAFMRAVIDRRDVDVAYRARSRDGQQRWIRDVGRVTLGDDGRPTMMFGIRLDITRQRLLEEQVHQAQKLDAVGRLAAGIAHDFNNLLVPIELSLDLCSKTAPESLRATLAPIREASRRAAKLTRQILAFSRKQVLDLRAVDLVAIVESFATMLRRLIGERINLFTEAEPELPLVRGDPTQIEQILLNLAVNARDAMPDGGTLTIRVRQGVWDETFGSLRTGGAAEYLELEVTDTGSGMDESTRARAFEPFFTTKPRGEGTGLGLATVHGIVEQHGGAVSVISAPGRGSTFRVLLPCALPSTANGTGHEIEPSTLFGDERILVVDDDAMISRLVGEVLTMHGYRVLVASNANAALALAAAEPCDLLLTDVVMPGHDGIQLYQRVRELRPRARVLFMSGYVEPLVVKRGAASTDTQLLEKPFTAQQLLKRIRQVLDCR